MLKYEETLNSLTIEQKLALIADFTALGAVSPSEYGFKFIAVSDVKDANEAAVYPSPNSLINSWSVDLIRKVSDDVTTRLKRTGVTLMGLPSAKVKSTPYSKGYTEDPILASTFAVQYAKTKERAGIGTYITEPYLTSEEVAYADVSENQRAVNEYFLRPINALLKNELTAADLKQIPSTGAYFRANEILHEKILSSLPIIKEKVSAEETMEYSCSERTYVKDGAVSALKDSYARYLEFRAAFEAGEISLSDVETACRSGNALSPEMIDQAAERILDFAATCNSACKKANAVSAERNLHVRAVEESIVLLKNENKTLPLRRSRVAVIGKLAEFATTGGISFKKSLESRGAGKGMNFVGYAKGYDGYKIINNALINEAVAIAKKSDVVLLFVGRDPDAAESERRNHNTTLPANQVALISAIKKLGKKVIAIIHGDCPDMSFDKGCSAVLLTPSVGIGAAEGLINVLVGIASPGGRLANTCYNNTDKHFDTLRKYKNAGRNQVNTFFGYRHYDTAGLKVKYPFGFGLGYSKFSYFGLRTDTNKITVCVRNTGRYPDYEVVQLYIGKKDSAIMRPKKELKAFKKVYLRPGASERITFEIKDLDLAVYDMETQSMVCERGEYEVYVGGNVSDERLTGKIIVNGRKLGKDGKKITDYFQNMSNIHANEYHLDVPMKVPKEGTEKRRKFFIVTSVVMVCLAIIYMYINYIGWLPDFMAIHIAVVAITALPIIFALGLTKAKKDFINKHMEVSNKMKKENREKLNVEDLMEEVPFEQLFEEEFKEEEIDFSDEQDELETEEEVVVKKEVFDEQFTLPIIQSEFSTFFTERGIIIDPVSQRSLLAGLAASRLIVLNSDEKELLGKFIPLLGEYLGTAIAVENAEDIHNGGDDVLVLHNEFGNSVTMTSIAASLIDESVDADKIRLMAVTDVTCEYLKPCLAQVFKYVDSPEKASQIYVRTDSVDDHFDMPENVWFVLTLKDGEKITDIPKYILDVACVVDLYMRAPKEDGKAKKKQIKKIKAKVLEEIASEVETVEENQETPVEGIIDEGAKIETEVQPQTENDVQDTAQEELEEQEVKQEEVAEVAEIEEDDKTEVKTPLFYQFQKLVSNALREYQLDETLWKRVDKLEDYVGARQNYKIDNKLWHRMEKFVAVYLAIGGVPEEALDSVVAHHVVYGMLPIVASNKEKNDDKFTHTIENIFGEGHAPYSIKVVKATGMNV